MSTILRRCFRINFDAPQVHCVSWSRDGAFFASGGADKSVIIWQSSGEGLLKFAHSDSLQARLPDNHETARHILLVKREIELPCVFAFDCV